MANINSILQTNTGTWMRPPGEGVGVRLQPRIQADGERLPSTLPDVLPRLRDGQVVLVVNDAGREGHGEFVVAASQVTAEVINLMVVHGRGLVCLPLTPQRCAELALGPMVPERAGLEETAFTVAIDLEVPGSTGISAADRARTIQHAVDPAARPSDFRRPGHVFPIRTRPGGVLAHAGPAEAAVDLVAAAGLPPAAVTCAVLDEAGRMATPSDLQRLADAHDLPLVTISDITAHRRAHPVSPSIDLTLHQEIA
jgi:3,4-dihydroxy 2-butanone 4-phosphate synthase / GTP cyclohydrolase II